MQQDVQFCAADDAQKLGVHGGGGAMPHAWNWSDDGDLYGGERRAASATAVLASRAAGSGVQRVSDVSERRAAPVLDFRTGIYRPEARHAPGRHWMRGSRAERILLAKRNLSGLPPAYLSGGLLETIGVAPVMGRLIAQSDDVPGAAVVTDLSFSALGKLSLPEIQTSWGGGWTD